MTTTFSNRQERDIEHMETRIKKARNLINMMALARPIGYGGTHYQDMGIELGKADAALRNILNML